MPVSTPAPPPRRQPLGHDAPPRDPRPLARDRDPGRVVLRPTARAASREDGGRGALPRRPRADPGDPGLGRLGDVPRVRGSVRECRSERRSRRSTRRTPTPRASRAGATRRRCTCATSRSSTELFPDAQYVHLIRDGRDAALSFLQMPEGTFTRTWAHPTTPAQFACLWRKEVGDARALGRRVGAARYHEVRYEALVADPDAAVRGDLRVRGHSVRAGDAGLRGRGRRLVEAASAAAARASDHAASGAGATTCRQRMSPRSRRSRATSCASSGTR